jgi:hypothetical protein
MTDCIIIGPEPRCRVCGVPARKINTLRNCPAAPAAAPKLETCGPGCQIKRTLSWFARDDGKCGCNEYAAYMDGLGPDGCEAKIDEIVAHLLEQAAKRSVFLGAVPAAIVVPIVRNAIAAARQAQKNAPS